jgi:REP element-mobilizing transposase RayT
LTCPRRRRRRKNRTTRTKPATGDRRSIRLKEFDYSAYGAYFVTICTQDRRRLLQPPRYRAIVQKSWTTLPLHFPGLQLEEIAIMPDHVHFLITILPASDSVAQGASRRAPTLADVVRAFKGNAAREINKARKTPAAPVWQRNYYERIVRNEAELERVREYIRNNPAMAHSHETDDVVQAWQEQRPV